MIAFALPCLAQAAAPEAAGAAPVSATDDAAAASTLTDYKLGVADKVRIIVFNEETLSGEFTVGDGGGLSLPLIGEVKAIGRSPREITKDIEAKLADGYLREPRVSLDVLSYRPFYILGEVSKPGEYPYSSGLTIFNAVARAEGFTYRANKRKIYIKRFDEVVEREIKLTPDLQIFPGDTVRIGERFF
ncbi:polysaccharide export protein [Sphingobium sp. JS3065]|uniref:polysaccharide biosynthesis/export family protein n=1 Tax=Sphingobium sp. JS3065 TaxID=2970925 RepID=UPI0022653616|nr:polysaccharide biosynthesis/export family protein [Sphingobium sp. JS3065]UZW56597.1 polysaccharide export protein [Sphingobium sp. JS3065]